MATFYRFYIRQTNQYFYILRANFKSQCRPIEMLRVVLGC